MERMKTFFIYALLIIGFYFLANFFINGYMIKMYQPIEKINIESNYPAVHIVEAKATNVNGYVLGETTNNFGRDINKTYLKIDFYSSQDVKMGTNYTEIENFASNQTKEFKVNFQYKDINRIDISFTNQAPEQVEQIQITDEHKVILFIATLIVLYFSPII